MKTEDNDLHHTDSSKQVRCGSTTGCTPCLGCPAEFSPGLPAQLLDSSAIATFVIDTGHRVVLWNRACEELTGIAARHIIGTDHQWKPFYAHRRPTLADIVLLGDYGRLDNLYNKHNRSPLNKYGIQAEGWYRNLGGRDRYIFFDAAPVVDDRGKMAYVIETLQDITEQRRSEEELRRYRDQLEDLVRERTAELQESNARLIDEITRRKQMEAEAIRAQKLDSLGLLAGGIAHDFNNLLTGVLGNISLARLDPNSSPRTRNLLAEAEKASNRARDLTSQLLTFSKGGAPVLKLLSVGALLRDSAGFALRGSRTSCELGIPSDLWAVEADEGQLSQVINNLIINADQAMPMGGTLLIRCENVTVDGAGTLPLGRGRYVKISFIDQGTGIHEDYLGRVFDPYFTTKQKGSGLGLATAYAIVTKHGGHISVSSRPGHGSVFEVYLPAREGAPDAGPRGDAQLHTGHGRVLVMDDEEAIRFVLGNMLEHLGYEPLLAADGEEAIGIFLKAAAEGESLAAVILDLTVKGGMGGLDCIARLREIDPRVKAIVSSGYSEDPVMCNHRRYGFEDIIVKPYLIENLAAVLSRVLAAPAP